MNDKMFRKSVIDRLSSPEQSDKRITVIKPYNWIVLAAASVLFVSVFLWGFFGFIPEKVSGSGMLLPSRGLVSIRYSSQGIIKDVFVSAGAEIKRGMVIARIERQDLLGSLQMSQRRLEDAEKLYFETSKSTDSSLSLTSQYRDRSKSDIQKQISVLDMQIKEFRRKEKDMKSLFESGIISGEQYLATRNMLLDYEKQRQDLQTNLINIDLNSTTNSNEQQRRILSLYQQMEEARKEFELQQGNYDTFTKVVSTVSGRVIEIPVVRGDFVTNGSTVAFIEEDVSGGSTLEAKIYFPASEGKKIKPGMRIGVVPSTVHQEEYGYIEGIVTDISEYPVSSQYLLSSIQNNSLAQYFNQIIAPMEVTASLIPNTQNYSGYKWSSSKGPDQKFSFGILCSGSVTVSRKKPIELLVPLVRKRLLGVGDDGPQSASGRGR